MGVELGVGVQSPAAGCPAESALGCALCRADQGLPPILRQQHVLQEPASVMEARGGHMSLPLPASASAGHGHGLLDVSQDLGS